MDSKRHRINPRLRNQSWLDVHTEEQSKKDDCTLLALETRSLPGYIYSLAIL